MLTKQDLKEEIEKLRKEFKNELEILLAQIVKAFSETSKDFATKEDLKNLATKEELRGVEGRLDGIEHRLDRVEADITDIKRDVQDIKADMPAREDFKTLKKLEDIHRKELSTYA